MAMPTSGAVLVAGSELRTCASLLLEAIALGAGVMVLWGRPAIVQSTGELEPGLLMNKRW